MVWSVFFLWFDQTTKKHGQTTKNHGQTTKKKHGQTTKTTVKPQKNHGQTTKNTVKPKKNHGQTTTQPQKTMVKPQKPWSNHNRNSDLWFFYFVLPSFSYSHDVTISAWVCAVSRLWRVWCGTLQTSPVCPSKTPLCVQSTRLRVYRHLVHTYENVFQHVRAVPVHTGTF